MTEERDSPRSFAPIRAFVRERVRSHRSQLVRIGRSHLEKYLKNAGVVSRLPEISNFGTRGAHRRIFSGSRKKFAAHPRVRLALTVTPGRAMTSASCLSACGHARPIAPPPARGTKRVPRAFRGAPVPSRFARRATRARAASGDSADLDEDWVKSNEDAVRASPLVVGGVSVATLLLNRILSGVAPVADASSGQSRADVLCLGMAGTLVLTGLQWLALKQKPPTRVTLEGVEVPGPGGFVDASLPERAREELRWTWDALRSATNCGSFVVVYRGARVSQAGAAPNAAFGASSAELSAELNTRRNSLQTPSSDARDRLLLSALASTQPSLGPICERCMKSGGGNYLANLALFPGRVEFETYLPRNAQAVVVTPVGNEGVMVAASGTQRGFTPADQAWMAVLAEKLDQTLSGETRA